MRRISKLFSLAIVAGTALIAGAQQQLDPTSEIQWNLAAGAGAPSAGCTQNGQYATQPYGAQWGQIYTNQTNGDHYTCSSAGWVKVNGAAGGGAQFAADGVIYMSTQGNDANSGLSPALAKLTLGAAYAALPSNGGQIVVASGQYVLGSAVVMATASKFLRLTCATPGDFGNAGVTFEFGPSSGTALTVGGGNSTYGAVQIEHCTFAGPGTGTSSIGVQLGSATVGSVGSMLTDVAIEGFGTGLGFSVDGGGGNNSYLNTMVNVRLIANGTGTVIRGENEQFVGGAIDGGNVGVGFGTSGDEVRIALMSLDTQVTNAIQLSNANGRGSCTGCHFEDNGTASNTYLAISAGVFEFEAGGMQTDHITGTYPGFIQQSGGNVVLNDVELWSSGATITQVDHITGGNARINPINLYPAQILANYSGATPTGYTAGMVFSCNFNVGSNNPECALQGQLPEFNLIDTTALGQNWGWRANGGFMDFVNRSAAAVRLAIDPSGNIFFGGHTNVVFPWTLTGYNGNVSGVKIPLALGWGTPSTLTTVCHDANGNLTDTGCPGSSSSAPNFPANPQTATYTVLASDFSSFKNITVASGTFTITLVASGSQPANGQGVWISNYGSGVITIARNGQNINGGVSSLTLAAGSATAPTAAFIMSDGANYFADLLPASAGGAIYPGPGVPQSTGSAWGTSITLGSGMAAAMAGAVNAVGGVPTIQSYQTPTTSSNAVAVNWALGNSATVTASGGAITSFTFSNPVSGTVYSLGLCNDGTARSWSNLPAAFKQAGTPQFPSECVYKICTYDGASYQCTGSNATPSVAYGTMRSNPGFLGSGLFDYWVDSTASLLAVNAGSGNLSWTVPAGTSGHLVDYSATGTPQDVATISIANLPAQSYLPIAPTADCIAANTQSGCNSTNTTVNPTGFASGYTMPAATVGTIDGTHAAITLEVAYDGTGTNVPTLTEYLLACPAANYTGATGVCSSGVVTLWASNTSAINGTSLGSVSTFIVAAGPTTAGNLIVQRPGAGGSGTAAGNGTTTKITCGTTCTGGSWYLYPALKWSANTTGNYRQLTAIIPMLSGPSL